MSIGELFQKKWRHLAVAGTTALLLGAGIFVVETLPPRAIAMVTGAEGGANFELGMLYREILAKEGVKLQLLPTFGGMENLARLRDPHSEVSVGSCRVAPPAGEIAPTGVAGDHILRAVMAFPAERD